MRDHKRENVPLKNPSELSARLKLGPPERLLLVDVPESLQRLLALSRPPECETRLVEGRAIQPVKQTFNAILLWREARVGSRSVLENLTKRLEPGGSLWVVTAMKKVKGPRTPAAHRLELGDLLKALSQEGFQHDREVRVSAWHVAYRFVKRQT